MNNSIIYAAQPGARAPTERYAIKEKEKERILMAMIVSSVMSLIHFLIIAIPSAFIDW